MGSATTTTLAFECIAATTPSGGGGDGGWTLEGVTILQSIAKRGCDSRLYSSEKKKNTLMTKDNMGGGVVSGIMFDVEVAVRGNGPSSSSTTINDSDINSDNYVLDGGIWPREERARYQKRRNYYYALCFNRGFTLVKEEEGEEKVVTRPPRQRRRRQDHYCVVMAMVVMISPHRYWDWNLLALTVAVVVQLTLLYLPIQMSMMITTIKLSLVAGLPR